MNIPVNIPMNLKDPSVLTGRAYYDGQWRDGDGGRNFEVTNPASGKVIAEVAASRVTERGSRADDKRSEAAMEDRKKQGYF